LDDKNDLHALKSAEGFVARAKTRKYKLRRLASTTTMNHSRLIIE
jgi:hypothetical protein